MKINAYLAINIEIISWNNTNYAISENIYRKKNWSWFNYLKFLFKSTSLPTSKEKKIKILKFKCMFWITTHEIKCRNIFYRTQALKISSAGYENFSYCGSKKIKEENIPYPFDYDYIKILKATKKHRKMSLKGPAVPL